MGAILLFSLLIDRHCTRQRPLAETLSAACALTPYHLHPCLACGCPALRPAALTPPFTPDLQLAALPCLLPPCPRSSLTRHLPPIIHQGTAKIADFGLARHKNKTFLSTKRPEAGTVVYQAPECFNDELGGISTKADVFSFGVILWEMVMRKPPWGHLEFPGQIIYQVGSGGAGEGAGGGGGAGEGAREGQGKGKGKGRGRGRVGVQENREGVGEGRGQGERQGNGDNFGGGRWEGQGWEVEGL